MADVVGDRVVGSDRGSMLAAAGPAARAGALSRLQRKVGNKATGACIGRRRLVVQRDDEAAFGRW